MGCSDILTIKVTSLTQFIEKVVDVAHDWSPVQPWFRGEPGNVTQPLTPMVFRIPRAGHHYDENNLLQTFRRRAHLLGLPIVPQRNETDQWLFLARHVGLPTRLLDWTEGALIGLYFAVLDENPVVWMLNPHELNLKTASDAVPNTFGLTWYRPEDGSVNAAAANVNAAWEATGRELEYPIAIEPTTIHPRMNAQHSYFTVHGKNRAPICEQVGTDAFVDSSWSAQTRTLSLDCCG